MNRTQLFPTVLIVLDVCSAFICLAGGDWRKFLYWMFAAGLTAVVTF